MKWRKHENKKQEEKHFFPFFFEYSRHTFCCCYCCLFVSANYNTEQKEKEGKEERRPKKKKKGSRWVNQAMNCQTKKKKTEVSANFNRKRKPMARESADKVHPHTRSIVFFLRRCRQFEQRRCVLCKWLPTRICWVPGPFRLCCAGQLWRFPFRLLLSFSLSLLDFPVV